MYCSQCGQQMPNNAPVCPSCGAPQGNTKFCSNCGTRIAANAVACPNCGARLEVTRAAAAAAPVAQMPPIIINNTSSSNNTNTNNNNLNNANGGGSIYQNQNYGGYARGPVKQLRTNRGLLKMILLSLITLGIYGLWVMYTITEDVNTIATPYDRKTTMNFLLLAFVFSWLTLGIAPFVWYHRISNRIGNELLRRGIPYKFGAGTFWGWGILGVIIIIGPLVYCHKMMKSMNLLCADYNVRG